MTPTPRPIQSRRAAAVREAGPREAAVLREAATKVARAEARDLVTTGANVAADPAAGAPQAPAREEVEEALGAAQQVEQAGEEDAVAVAAKGAEGLARVAATGVEAEVETDLASKVVAWVRATLVVAVWVVIWEAGVVAARRAATLEAGVMGVGRAAGRVMAVVRTVEE